MMLFSARLEVLLDLLLKHRHFYPPRYFKLAMTLLICVILQRSIKKEERFYQEKVQHLDIVDDPVFITGHWRSGTTYLHYLMSLDIDNFAYPTNYQCFFPTLYLTFNEQSWLYKLLNRLMGIRTRVIDNMELRLDLPQEEEWMYPPEGGFSYILEKLIFPRTAITDYNKIIELSNDKRTKEITLKIFKKLTYAYHKRILSKSPGHFSRIPTLKELFPNGKFLFIVRNPYDVVLSMMHAGKILGRMLSLQRSEPDDVTSIAKFLMFYFDTMHKHIQLLQPNDHVLLRYEDLIQDPIKNIENIYNTFGFPYTNNFENSLRGYLESVKDYKRNRFDLGADTKDLIYRHCQRIFDEYSYPR
ncbi:MAG TPA: sulfotransferase [Alphaproteobacteria bacterium]|nr:sulfotransferase [Alphaproteobacteria bacterium]